jgi:hypothetical protein
MYFPRTRQTNARPTGWWVGLGMFLGSVACAPPSDSTSVTLPESALLEEGTQAPKSATTIFARMPAAPRATAYKGTRRIEVYDRQGLTTLAYREAVGSDGAGSFFVETSEVLTQHPVPDLFIMIQDNRRNFTYRYRDFQVRDLARFERNFKVTVVSASEQLVGRDCIVLDVAQRSEGLSSYRVHVDAQTALVLRAEERMPDGTLVSLLEFESFELVTDERQLVNNVLFALPAPVEQAQRIEFNVLVPQVLPSGYDLEQLTRLEAAGTDLGESQVWARYQYGNGVEQLFFLHQEQLPAEPGGTPDKGDVQVFPVGGWNVVVGEVNRYPVILMGKVPSDALLHILESVF